ncbi:sensor histidine kinase [Granulicatella seriolae]|uniref:histidine kinase n=1 Tax=Granulicatella seriolae TaxID=2967226 RepID=A0ABT1WMZ3_9LACT|nr:ATP-binding protein [Granulicatella seriolae]
MKKLDAIVFRIWIINVAVSVFSLFIIISAFYQTDTKGIYFIIPFILVMIVYYVAFYVVLNRWLTDPIKKMTDIAFRFSQNDFQHKVVFSSQNEFLELGLAMNKLGKSLQINRIGNHEKQEMLGHILENLPTAIAFISQDFSVLFQNSNGVDFLRLWGNQSLVDYQVNLPIELEKRITHIFQTQQTTFFKLQLEQKNFSVTMIPLFHEDQQKVRGIFLIANEITEQDRLEKLRTDFISNVSHDLRTPLVMVKGYSEAILDDVAATLEEKNEMARIINDEATEMAKLVNSLLELSKMQSGILSVKLKEVSTKEFFDHLVNRFKGILQHESFSITIDIAPKSDTIFIDEEKLHQALFNLIDNAIRYVTINGKPTKEITITVKNDFEIEHTSIVISDNGNGIREQDLPFIFERFYKSDKSRELDKSAGSGIGLSIVKSVIDQHKGTIDVHSVIGQGTQFFIKLPIVSYLSHEDDLFEKDAESSSFELL